MYVYATLSHDRYHRHSIIDIAQRDARVCRKDMLEFLCSFRFFRQSVASAAKAIKLRSAFSDAEAVKVALLKSEFAWQARSIARTRLEESAINLRERSGARAYVVVIRASSILIRFYSESAGFCDALERLLRVPRMMMHNLEKERIVTFLAPCAVVRTRPSVRALVSVSFSHAGTSLPPLLTKISPYF